MKHASILPAKIYDILKTAQHPLKLKKIITLGNIANNKKNYDLALDVLQQLIDNQKVTLTINNEYLVTKKKYQVEGKIIKTRNGNGFFISEAFADAYISQRELDNIISDDLVIAQINNGHKKRPDANIIKLIKRSTVNIVGTYNRKHNKPIVRVDSKPIGNIQLTTTPNIPENSKVLVKLDKHNPQLFGKIEKVVDANLSEDEQLMEEILHRYNIAHIWSKSAIDESKHLATTAEDKQVSRIDLRELTFITIDGEDSKDLDDAIYLEQHANGFKLLVAIADVAHYIQPNTILDKEASTRGNSVYFPRQVIPMLPENISNNLCSLQPNKERLAVVCEMLINKDGVTTQSKFYNAVFKSHNRFTYTQVAEILSQPDQPILDNKYNRFIPMLKSMQNAHKALLKQRANRGALAFHLPEIKAYFDAAGNFKTIKPYKTNIACSLIEEFMLAANTAAAILTKKHNIPSLYREHPAPAATKVNELRNFLNLNQLSIDGQDTPTAKDYNNTLTQVSNHHDINLVQTMMLRSLTRACYNTNPNSGHFGLAYAEYTHFTSPIRRYSDLVVHRNIKILIAQNKAHSQSIPTDTQTEHAEVTSELDNIGKNCSFTEWNADEASREVLQFYKCQFAQQHIDKMFTGTISSVLSFGMFITLDKIHIDGLLPVYCLGKEHYEFDVSNICLIGNTTGTRYTIGDQINVKIDAVNLAEKQITFSLEQVK